ncbi:MAG: FHA domain-containing protein [Magnetococcales bacterium]|nr:FHA domain-containing protein [Magnetococcales bacterium]MBF0114743.1 FHA domain-containing protein [Magnetococcales bacterium]
MAKVIVKFKETVRSHITLQKACTSIGRTSANDIAIENLAVSRRHAEIVRLQDRFLLRDLHSSNGTYVNGLRIVEHTLCDGDTILIGKHTLLFIVDDALALAMVAAPKVGHDPDTFLRSTMEWEVPVVDADAATTLLAASVDSPPAFLLVRAGSLEQDRYLLSAEATMIGAADYADIRLTATNAPAVAAVIRRRSTGYDISPSEPGVLLNKRKLITQQPLEHGALITVQGVIFEFRAWHEGGLPL